MNRSPFGSSPTPGRRARLLPPDAVDLGRRRFLRRAVLAGALAAGGGTLAACGRLGGGPADVGLGSAPQPDPTGRLVAGAVEGRILVLVDLQGGNDGLSTVVPAASARYHDLRPELAVPEGDVLALDDEVGLHPSLARLHRRGVVAVEGVGPVAGDLSHFTMTARWQRGDVDGDEPGLRTGFLGRLADAVDDGSPLVGVSVHGPTPYLANHQAATLALSSPDQLWMLSPWLDREFAVFQEGVARFDRSGGSAVLVESYRRLLDLAEQLSVEDDDLDWDSPMLAEGGELGWQLHLAADLLAAGVGTRVVYAGTGDYDTHTGHQWRQADNLAQVDAAVDGFLDRVADLGLADRVVVATVSEFGRRVPQNDDGLDHGAASTMLVTGAGVGTPGGGVRRGVPHDLDDLDEDDNLRTTIGFDRYLGSLAQEWLGVEAASVLQGEPEPLGLV